MRRGSAPLEVNWECHRLLHWFQSHCTAVLAAMGPGLSPLPPMQPGPFPIWVWGLSWVLHSLWGCRRELSWSAGSVNSLSFPQSLVQSRKAGITSALASSTLNNEELVGAGVGWVGDGGRGKLSLGGRASSGGAESVPHQHPLVMPEHPGCSWQHLG